MTVKELIEKLQEMPQDAQVYYDKSSGDNEISDYNIVCFVDIDYDGNVILGE